MNNPIDIHQAHKEISRLPRTITDIAEQHIDTLKDTSANIDSLKKPYYRVWHYIKNNWDTGYSANDIVELRMNFGALKSSQKMLANVIWDMELQNLTIVPTNYKPKRIII